MSPSEIQKAVEAIESILSSANEITINTGGSYTSITVLTTEEISDIESQLDIIIQEVEEESNEA